MQNDDVNMFSKESVCSNISIYLAYFFKYKICFIL